MSYYNHRSRRRSRSRIDFLPIAGGVLIVLAIVALILSGAFYAHGTTGTETLTVERTERIQDSSGGSKYLVFTDKGVYENTDSIWHLKFDSSDLYGDLEEGQTYSVDYYGWRIPFFSSYRNIIEATPAS